MISAGDDVAPLVRRGNFATPDGRAALEPVVLVSAAEVVLVQEDIKVALLCWSLLPQNSRPLKASEQLVAPDSAGA